MERQLTPSYDEDDDEVLSPSRNWQERQQVVVNQNSSVVLSM